MADHEIRVLDESNFRAAHTLFRGALHSGPATDERWEQIKASYDPGRAFGAFQGDEMVGTAQSWPALLAVPGGAEVPAAAVSRVGVRADWTRRGVLSALMRRQFQSCREAGEVVSVLRASEAVIYGRFGYGVASRGRQLKVDRHRVALAPSDGTGGRIRLVDLDTATAVAPEVYAKAGLSRPGMTSRWPAWWLMNLDRGLRYDNARMAVHSGADGDDGFVVYVVKGGMEEPHGKSVLTVEDLVATTPEVWAELWRFVFRVDVVDEVIGELRPLDEPLEWLVADRRVVKVTDVEDETWLRLLDVPAALAARRYAAAEPVVLQVRDRYLPDNDGSYRITPDGVERTTAAADLVLDVDLLAATYLGDVSFTELAQAGRVDVVDGAALARADALFATGRAPWSGTYF
ncbi:GNAT family N-acetyltransferase [Umezawaea endophytica]|uniref:GNAT family N-acetyltransferase n=1 Tax=Umezawaea endophytica TaxID=1654476 RepID=A0A9X2VQR0_9PSEU|nr:GNAT family N-acetyltransferase [Umezawaea endophytica]MCS7480971.1 GNAT family N-acetyltransferase [Umezawaea endophytica]